MMISTSVLFLCVLQTSVFAQTLWHQEEIIQDLHLPHVPNTTASVIFACGATAELGNYLDYADLMNSPFVSWKINEDTLYTILLLDLDTPSRTNHSLRAYIQMMVINVPGKLTGLGNTLFHYVSAVPDRSSGAHRYAVLIYKQTKRIELASPAHQFSGSRSNFEVNSFAKKHQLIGPIAGNFWKVLGPMEAKYIFIDGVGKVTRDYYFTYFVPAQMISDD